MKICATPLSILILAVTAYASTLSTTEAGRHVGENATVCGIVAGIHTATSSKGSPTFVNLDKAYPNQVFTILICGSDRGTFSPASWQGKNVCATGVITLYRGSPEIVAHDEWQMSFPN